MLTTKEIIEEVTSLPIEERSFIADSILKSLNSPNKDIDDKWISIAKNRLNELRLGEVTGRSGRDVMEKMRKRFSE